MNPSTTIASLVDCLRHDPFYAAITVDFAGDERARREVLGHYFDYSMSEARRLGKCVVASDVSHGAALWLWPAQTDVVPVVQAKTTFLEGVLGPRGMEHYRRLIEFMEPRAEAVVDASAWYLSIVGVLPQVQGRGIGSRLLQPTLLEADRAGVPIYLETFSPRSLRFYERLGFKSLASHVEPGSGGEYVIMQRAPGCAAQ
ncbi:MAG: GNAT family N-acetyltransferase [Thermoleophilia bacterium]